MMRVDPLTGEVASVMPPIVGVSISTVQADRQVFSSEHLANEPQTARSRFPNLMGETDVSPLPAEGGNLFPPSVKVVMATRS